jgi:hypothetical protein
MDGRRVAQVGRVRLMQVGESRRNALRPGERRLASHLAAVEPIAKAALLGVLQRDEEMSRAHGFAQHSQAIDPDDVGMGPQADPAQAFADEELVDVGVIEQGRSQALEHGHTILVEPVGAKNRDDAAIIADVLYQNIMVDAVAQARFHIRHVSLLLHSSSSRCILVAGVFSACTRMAASLDGEL